MTDQLLSRVKTLLFSKVTEVAGKAMGDVGEADEVDLVAA